MSLRAALLLLAFSMPALAQDAGVDAGEDAGVVDAGEDAGLVDPEDAGQDAGLDAGQDAGTVDAGEPDDAGLPIAQDAGVDPGPPIDTGEPLDDDCGDVSARGQCDGSTIVFCRAGELVESACAAGLICVDDGVEAACVIPEPDPSCASLTPRGVGLLFSLAVLLSALRFARRRSARRGRRRSPRH